WRSYYIDLVNYIENYYQNPIKYGKRREDYDKIVNYIMQNTERYRDMPEKWAEDFINLNAIFDERTDKVRKILDIPWTDNFIDLSTIFDEKTDNWRKILDIPGFK